MSDPARPRTAAGIHSNDSADRQHGDQPGARADLGLGHVPAGPAGPATVVPAPVVPVPVVPAPVVVGIDVGGSKTHGVRSQGGSVLADAVRGAANPSSVGLPAATRELDLLIDDLLASDPGVRIAAVCIGASGADSDGARRRLGEVLQRRLPGVPVRVVHDTELVLAAAGLDEGVVVISGTGSSAWGRTLAGEQARAGGWGYLLGDVGSGYGVTRAAVQHTLDAADAGRPLDVLGRAVLEACGATGPEHLLDLFYAAPARRLWASRAPLVFTLAEARDPAAAAVVEGAGAELVEAAARVARRLHLAGPVVFAGGLARHQPLLQATVRAGLARHGIDDVRILDTDPVVGAVRLAEAVTVSPVA